MKKFILYLACASFAMVAFTACSNDDDMVSFDYMPESVEVSEKPNAAPAPGDMTIAEIVVDAATDEEQPQFTLLLAALEYTGLTGVFTGGDQYTVFAPTDQAFINTVVALGVSPETPFADIDAALGEGTVATILLYHVAEGRRAANSVVPKNGTRTITTLAGATFNVNPDLSIDAIGNSGNIISANISASNGIIHVIDTVILPIEL